MNPPEKHKTIQNLKSRLDRYDLDWSHRHFKQNPTFLHKAHPNPTLKLQTPYSIKPSQEAQQMHIRGVQSTAVFPSSKIFNRNYQHPMTYSVGPKQVFVYEKDPICENEQDPKWRRDFRDRYFNFTKNFELENFGETSTGKNSSKFFPHLTKYHALNEDVRHPKFYDSDLRYFPYQKNFLASDKVKKIKIDYSETIEKIREELELNKGIKFKKEGKTLEEVLTYDPQFSNALIQGNKEFYLFFIAFLNEVIQEIEILQKFQEMISQSETFDHDLIYDSLFENLENEGKKIEKLDIEIFVQDIMKPFLDGDDDLIVLEEDYDFFKNLSTSFFIGEEFNRFSFRKFLIGNRHCSNVVTSVDINKENLEIFSTVLKIYVSVIKKLKYLSRIFFKKSSNFLESIEEAFPYKKQRILERDFHAFLIERKVKCMFESSNFMFRLLDSNNNRFFEAFDIYTLIKIFN